MSSQAISELLKSRRTVHDFKPGVIEPELILDAIEHARWAPNHYLTEPWRFYLLNSETAEKIAVLNAELVAATRHAKAAEVKLKRWREIPNWLVMTCARSDDEERMQEDYAASCCAAHNMSLYLWSHGVGMKWTTGDVTKTSEFFKLIDVNPAEERIVGLFWYGYPREIPEQRRRAVEEIVTRR
ncbi:MAG: nitroreductase [Pseudomonadota bacterium]